MEDLLYWIPAKKQVAEFAFLVGFPGGCGGAGK
jgi:hypothetical protein